MRAARVATTAAVVADRGVDRDEEMGKGERTSAVARKFRGSRASQGRAALTSVRNCKEKERKKKREREGYNSHHDHVHTQESNYMLRRVHFGSLE
jgi:hypothetical protein